MVTRWGRSVSVLAIAVAALVAGCQRAPADGELKLAPAGQLPPRLREAPGTVQEAYRFAVANKALLQQIPCFCGCVASGHRSNYDCYVAADGGPGRILEYDSHALG